MFCVLRLFGPFAIFAGLLALPAGAAAADIIKDCADCPPLVMVPAGSFVMGSSTEQTTREGLPDQYVTDEQPQHKVTIAKPFALGEFPVTRGEFAAFVRESGHNPKGCLLFSGGEWKNDEKRSWRNTGYVQDDKHPVVCVSFEDAQAYVAWLSKKTGKSYRLPSEAEWEYAARAGSTTTRFWGDGREDACQYANVGDLYGANRLKWDKTDKTRVFQCNDGFVYTSPVGSFKPNAFGLYDMLGNVYQWTADCVHDGGYKDAPSDGSAWTGDKCDGRAQRGGSWSNGPWGTRSAGRNGGPPKFRNIDVGFRVVRKAP
jgi:formylglycine-generating enzyme required for sulfatase activity